MVGATPLLLTSLFPTEVRGRLVGIVYHVGAALAALVPTATAALATFAHMRLGTAVVLTAGFCELALAVVVLVGRRMSHAAPDALPAEVPMLEAA
jgi:SHS family lactate transporter-like MFS transporter